MFKVYIELKNKIRVSLRRYESYFVRDSFYSPFLYTYITTKMLIFQVL